MRFHRIAAIVLLMSCCGYAGVIVGNPSFETPSLTPAGAFVYRPTGAGVDWTFVGSSGITSVSPTIPADGSNFGMLSAPNGTQAAFLQKGTGNISETVTGLVAGQGYVVAFQAAQRPDGCCSATGTAWGGEQDFNVLWNGSSLGTFMPPSTGFSSYVTVSFQATATTGLLAFQALDIQGGLIGKTDQTAFVDAVAVNQAPEPANGLLVLSGLGLIGLGLRRWRVYSR
jgi:PEP-CTERM motif